MKWLMGFVPGIGPAFTALMNPWIILGFVLVLASAFFYGLHIGNERLEAYQMTVKAVGEAQEQRTKTKIAEGKTLKLETDNAHKKQVATLNRDIAVLSGDVERLRKRASGSFLPPVAPGSSLSKSISPAYRDHIDGAIQQYSQDIRSAVGGSLAEITGYIAEGTRSALDLQCGREWVDKARQILR